MSPQEIIEQYVETCSILKETTLSGDYKKGNKEGKKNVVTRTKSAAHCLSLKIYIDEAEKVLKEIAADKNNGIFGFDAEMTLKIWYEHGYLKVYPQQKV